MCVKAMVKLRCQFCVDMDRVGKSFMYRALIGNDEQPVGLLFCEVTRKSDLPVQVGHVNIILPVKGHFYFNTFQGPAFSVSIHSDSDTCTRSQR